MIMKICVIFYGQASPKSSASVAGDDRNLNMIEDSFFYRADTEQARDKDNLDEILVNYRLCRKN